MIAYAVIVAIVVVAWRVSFWPFDRSYKYLPKYGSGCHHAKALPTAGPKTGA
jgi:hypothetical protein